MNKHKKFQRVYVMLIAALLLAFYMTFQLTIAETIDKYLDVQDLKEKEHKLKDANQDIQNLKRQLADIESKLGNGNENVKISLFKSLTKLCNDHDLILKQMPTENEFNEGNLLFQQNSFILEGSFKNLLLLASNLENQQELGKIISMKFNVEEDRRYNKRKLYATCIIQNILSR